jgi:hypothetical protein
LDREAAPALGSGGGGDSTKIGSRGWAKATLPRMVLGAGWALWLPPAGPWALLSF